MWHLDVQQRLTAPQRELLVAHVVAPQPFATRVSNAVRNVRNALIRRKLIRFSGPLGAQRNGSLRTHTCLTMDGRAVAGYALAHEADGLVAAGYLNREGNTPVNSSFTAPDYDLAHEPEPAEPVPAET